MPTARAAAGCFVLVLGVYLGLGQETFYKVDGQYLVHWLSIGRIEHPYNLLYMPAYYGLSAVLSPLGLSAYQVATLFSALGMALGVALVQVGFRRLGLQGAGLWLATGLVALSPPLLFFATVVEFHGPFFAAAGLAFWLMTELAHRPRWWVAVLLGLVTHLAYAAHSSGNVLPALLLTWYLALRWPEGRFGRDFLIGTIAGLAHIALFLLLVVLELPAPMDVVAAALEEGIGERQGLDYLPTRIWNELLWPYLPLSLLWFGCFRKRELRLQGLAVLFAIIPYIALCQYLLADEQEFGAYLLPMAIPFAWLSVNALPRPLMVTALLISAGLGLRAIVVHDDPATARAWAEGYRAVVAAEPARLVIVGYQELGYALIELPEERFRLVQELGIEDPEQYPAQLAEFEQQLLLLRGSGQSVLFTEGAWLELDHDRFPFGPTLREFLEPRLPARPVESGAFRAWRLR